MSISIVDILIHAKIASSKREAKELLNSGSILVNGDKASINLEINESHLLHGEYLAIRKGKKNWTLVQFPPK